MSLRLNGINWQAVALLLSWSPPIKLQREGNFTVIYRWLTIEDKNKLLTVQLFCAIFAIVEEWGRKTVKQVFLFLLLLGCLWLWLLKESHYIVSHKASQKQHWAELKRRKLWASKVSNQSSGLVWWWLRILFRWLIEVQSLSQTRTTNSTFFFFCCC